MTETRQSVAIFGAGIAGLTAAHELCRLGYKVSVYESNDQPGGFFRSARLNHNNMPSEYSWHGMGPWYHNTFDLMQHIPATDETSLYDTILSEPIDFGIFPHDIEAHFYDAGLLSIPKMFRMDPWQFAKWSYLMLKAWTSHQRGEKEYALINAASAWRPLMKDTAYRTWRSCFGPWIGSDWTNVSLYTCGDFFRKQLTTRPTHYHQAGVSKKDWTHGAGDGWLLLRGPSNESWFSPWMEHLRAGGVEFFFGKELTELDFDGSIIRGAWCGGEPVKADYYLMAVNPFYAAEIIQRTPELAAQDTLRLLMPLTAQPPHTQVSFRLAFSEQIHFPRARTAVVLSDSEFNLTLFAQEQAWGQDVDLGRNIQSLWTGTSCTGTVPGRLYHKPVEFCTKEQFIAEVRAQIYNCGALDLMIQEANDGRRLKDFTLVDIEVWHEWHFSPHGIRPLQPKWVNNAANQRYMPAQKTPVANLLLAGAHTKTEAHVWSIEAAVESGRRAAREIDGRVVVIEQYIPGWLKIAWLLDDFLFRWRLPQLINTATLLPSAFLLSLLL